jgi:putative transposase
METARHHRKIIRLKEFDYSLLGAYFVTICTFDKMSLLGKIEHGEMNLSQQGTVAHQCWKELPEHFQNIILDVFVVMPNHVHGIIIITDPLDNLRRDLIYQIPNADVINHVPTEWGLMKNQKITLGKIVRYYKARSTKFIHDAGCSDFQWQSRFYDRIIRDKNEYDAIRKYIYYNPAQWETDEEYN